MANSNEDAREFFQLLLEGRVVESGNQWQSIKMASEPAVTKKRCGYINDEQKKVLIEFMGEHLELQSGKFSATFTYKHGQKLWEQVTTQLYEIPGAMKEWKQWRKTWQDMRSSTKAKNTSPKNHTKGTGGGPTSSQVLTEIDQNVLALIGSTAVEGHDTVQESNVEFRWDDDPEGCNIEYLSGDEGIVHLSSMQYTHQEVVQNSTTLKPLTPRNYYRSETEEYYISNENSNYSNDNNNNNNSDTKKNNNNNSDTKKNNNNNNNNEKLTKTQASVSKKIPVPPIVNSTTQKKVVKKTSAAQRYDRSIQQTEQLAKISQKDAEVRKSYYDKKLVLYEKEIALKERDVTAKENLIILLEQLLNKS